MALTPASMMAFGTCVWQIFRHHGKVVVLTCKFEVKEGVGGNNYSPLCTATFWRQN